MDCKEATKTETNLELGGRRFYKDEFNSSKLYLIDVRYAHSSFLSKKRQMGIGENVQIPL